MRFSVLVGAASDVLGAEIMAVWRDDAISVVSQQQWHNQLEHLNSGCMFVVCVDPQPIFFFFLSRIHILHITAGKVQYFHQIRWDNLHRSSYCCFLCHVILLEMMIQPSAFSEPFNTYQDESVFLNCFSWVLNNELSMCSTRRLSPHRGPFLDRGGLKPSLLHLPQYL